MKVKQLPQSMNLIPNMFQDLTITDLNYLLACLLVSSGVQAQRALSHAHMEACTEIPKLPPKDWMNYP